MVIQVCDGDNWLVNDIDIVFDIVFLQLLYLDDCFVVVNKFVGFMVYDSKLVCGEDDFFVDCLCEQFGKLIFFVYCFDCVISGCLLFVFDCESVSVFGKLLMGGDVDKDYLVICCGWLVEDVFMVDYDLDGGLGKLVKKQVIIYFQCVVVGEIVVLVGEFEILCYVLLCCQLQIGCFCQICWYFKYLLYYLIGDISYGDGCYNCSFCMQGIYWMLLYVECLCFLYLDGIVMDVSVLVDGEFCKVMDLFGWYIVL